MKLDEIGAYWNTRAEGYSLSIQEELKNGTDVRFLELFRAVQPGNGKLNCLDVGCGPAFFSILLNRLGHTVTSVDYSQEMLTQAQANLNNSGFTPNVLRGDAQNLPFADGSFDFIVSRNLVWNLEQPEKAYREWMRLLKPGGRLLVVDGNHYLYYYSEDYRLSREAAAKKQGQEHTYGVDPTPINEIARDLPLSRCLRPDWDQKTLEAIGLKNIGVNIHTRPFTHPVTGEEKQLVGSFEIWGEK